MAKPQLKQTSATPFKDDFIKLCRNGTGVNMGKYMYSRAMHPNDSVRGASIWSDVVSHCPQYYVSRAEVALIQNIVSTTAERYAGLIDFGCGSADAVLYKALPLIKAFAAKHYQPIDINLKYLKQAKRLAGQYAANIVTTATQHDFSVPRPAPLEHIPDTESPFIGIMLGGTAMNINSGEQAGFPVQDFINLIHAVMSHLREQDQMVITYDSCPDLLKVKHGYDSPLQHDFSLNLLALARRELNIQGDLATKNWRYEPQVQRSAGCLIVSHQLRAVNDISFFIDNECFTIAKDQCLIFEKSIKPAPALISSLLARAGYYTQDIIQNDQKTATWHRFSRQPIKLCQSFRHKHQL